MHTTIQYRRLIQTTVTGSSLLLLLVLFTGCSMFSSAPVDEYMEEQEIDYYSYMDIAPLREVEDRLTSAFADQVDWDNYDQKALVDAITAIKSEFEWLKLKVVKGDRIVYYEAKVANDKVNYFWGVARKVLDDISINGEVDEDTSLIYHFVRRDIQRSLISWTQSLERAKSDIDGKIKAYDAAQVKAFVESVEPLIGKLPFI